MKLHRSRTKAKPVNFDTNQNDWKVLVLASFGFTTNCIARETGFTPSQVQYRIQKGGLVWSRYNYRNGFNNTAQRLIRLGIDEETQEEIRKAMVA